MAYTLMLHDGNEWSLETSFATSEERDTYCVLLGLEPGAEEALVSPDKRDQLIRLGFGAQVDVLSQSIRERDVSMGMLNPLGRTPTQIGDWKIPTIMGNLIISLLMVMGCAIDASTMQQFISMAVADMPSYLGELLTSAPNADVLGTILKVYRHLLSTNQKVLDHLLNTGDSILVYKTKEDVTLGVVEDKKAKTKEGKNLLGNALMFLRYEFGGAPDPRLGLLRGKRKFQAVDLQPCPEPESEGEREWAVEQAILLAGRQGTGEKQVLAWQDKVQQLTDFICRTQWWAFPEFPVHEEHPLRVVLVMDGDKSSMPGNFKAWISKLYGAGYEFYSAKKHMMLGEGYLLPCSDTLPINGVNYPTIPYDQRDASAWLELSTRKMSDWYAWYLSEQTAKLQPEDVAELAGILMLGRMGAQVSVSGPVVTLKKGSELYTWNFKSRTVTARNGRSYKAFRKAIINEMPTDSMWVLLTLCLQAQMSFKSINGTLASLTNLWEREANYGHSWEDNHPTRIIRDNSGAPLKFKSSLNGNDPFKMKITNGSFSTSLVDRLISSEAYRHDIFLDKNSMKLMAGAGAGAAALTGVWYPEEAHKAFHALDAGVNPLLVLSEILSEEKLLEYLPKLLAGMPPAMVILEECGWFVTMNDGAKVTKFLNRAQQGGSWNEAYCWLTWQGETLNRVMSAMGVLQNKPAGTTKASAEDEAGLLALANANSRVGRKAAK